MLMRSRLILFLSLIVVATVLLAACGKDSETAAPQAESPDAGVAVATGQTQAPEPTLVPGPAVVANPTQAPVPTPSDTPVVVEGTGGANAPGAVVVTLSALAEELPTVEVVKILTPSVVQIVTEVAGMGFSNDPNPQSGVGTGVVLNTDGHILTNNHVVSGAQRITVTFSDGESFSAIIVGTDPTSDLAVIKVAAENLVPAMLGDSSALHGGLEPEDIIVELDGEAIRNTGDLAKFLISHQPGYSVEIVVIRDGARLSRQLTLGDRPPN